MSQLEFESMIKNQILESILVKNNILEDTEILSFISKISDVCIEAIKGGNKIIFAGNGGSAADAQHLAGELVSRFYFDRPALPAISITTDTSILTAIGNDYGFVDIFSRQIKAIGNKGDVFIAISTSGKSDNIIEALKHSKKIGISTVGLTGNTGGDFVEYCDYIIKVPSNSTPRIQEIHIMIGHIICSIIENKIFGVS